MVYSWKECNKYPVSAQVAGETIENLRHQLGKEYIEAEDLLEASRNENAPLHFCFDWNNDTAAEKYRLWQAKDIIRSITVTIEKAENTLSEPVRAFVSVADLKAKGKFVAIQTAMENSDYRAQILKNALAELQSFKRKYNAYSELSKVFTAIDEIADSLKYKKEC